MRYAQVVIDISHEALDRPFTYLVPDHLKEQVFPGAVVDIPFGKGNTQRRGYVLEITSSCDYPPEKLKEILAVRTGIETTEGRLISLAAWMRERYGSTMIGALRTVVPIRDKVKEKKEKILVRTSSEEEVRGALSELTMRERGRIRILEALLSYSRIEGEALKSLQISASQLAYLEEKGLARLEESFLPRNPLMEKLPPLEEAPPLSDAQERAAAEIREEWAGEGRPVLLKGVTGSGKTSIYMELIEETLAQGKQAIVLVPEIALTYQTVRRFAARFGEGVWVISSQLSAGERYDAFRLAKEGRVRVMVGPRSALFTPFSNLGLIIIDEEHESSYKSEQSPRYHARETAIHLAKMQGARVILGSATPSLGSYFAAKQGKYRLVSLDGRFGDAPLAPVEVVDMRQELRKGNRSMLSLSLSSALGECLDGGFQAMLFLNRRGVAGFVSCRSCGEVVKCPHCDVSLAEHNGGILVCHYCGYSRPFSKKCSHCGEEAVYGFRAGTQQVEKLVAEKFPKAKILRMDYDTTRKKGSYEDILGRFARGEANVLIGTQMIVKGHDFPRVTLVGALAADLSLNSGDYAGAERTFQLLAQAAGRAGRGSFPGRAIFQTYQPDHPCMQAAALQDYEAFYGQEIAFRELLSYPPVGHMLEIMGAGPEEKHLSLAMEYIRKFILRYQESTKVAIIGPAFASVGKIKDTYHMRLILKHEREDVLLAIRSRVEKYVEVNTGFASLTLQYEFHEG